MRRILFFTGAGLSADSGISTFRDNEDGLWTKYNPNVVANIHTFEQNKNTVFKFYNERRLALPSALPNAAHEGIGKVQQRYGADRVLVFTQNIDDLLERGGCSVVHHVHGELKKMRCLNDPSHVWDIGYNQSTVDDRCVTCGGATKPAVVFFGETAPAYQLLYDTFFSASKEDLIVVIGTSGTVIPISHIIGPPTGVRGGRRILCNSDDRDWLPYEAFDQLFLGKAAIQIEGIVSAIDDWMTGHA